MSKSMLLNEALEGFSKFSANEVSKVRNIVFVIVFIFGFKNCNVVLLDARAANIGSNSLALMPQSHTHLRTLRMIRKARPQRSVHSVTIRNYTYIIRRVRNSSYLIRKSRSIRAKSLKNIKKVLRMNKTQ